jgi:hypothetical protein
MVWSSCRRIAVLTACFIPKSIFLNAARVKPIAVWATNESCIPGVAREQVEAVLEHAGQSLAVA